MTQRSIYESQTVDTIRIHVELGSYDDAAAHFKYTASRLVHLSISPSASYKETEAGLLNLVKVALDHCQKDAFPHA